VHRKSEGSSKVLSEPTKIESGTCRSFWKFIAKIVEGSRNFAEKVRKLVEDSLSMPYKPGACWES
ncbi:unnamed protein product, partial [Musa textilis]